MKHIKKLRNALRNVAALVTKNSIHRQLIIGVAFVHLILMSIFVYDLVQRQKHFLIERAKTNSLFQAEVLAKSSLFPVVTQDLGSLTEILEPLKNDPAVIFAMVTDVDGRVLGHTDPTLSGQQVIDPETQKVLRGFTRSALYFENENILSSAAPIRVRDKLVGWTFVTTDLKNDQAHIAYVTRSGLFYTLLAIIIGSIFAVILGRSITRPLKKLLKGTQRIGNEHWSEPIVVETKNEIGTLSTAFNEAMAKLFAKSQEISRINQDLRTSESKFRILVESMPQMVWTANSEGKVEYFNPCWYSYTEYASEINLRSVWHKIIHPDDFQRCKDTWNNCLTTGEVFSIEYRLRRSDGAFRWHIAKAVPVKDHSGQILKWFGTATDIEDQKRAVESLKMAMRDRDEFISLASHELRTPITSMKLQLQLTQRSMSPKLRAVAGAEGILGAFDNSFKQVDKLTGLVEDLLDVSRIQAGKLVFRLAKVNLSDVIRDVIDTMGPQIQTARCEVRLELEENIVGKWDSLRIEQIFLNLLSNSTKYAPQSTIEIKTFTRGPMAYIEVSDSGPGIEKEMQNTIFDRFERTTAARNIGGLGLGLYIVKEVVTGHNGSIKVESETGQGAKFIIALPLNPEIIVDTQNVVRFASRVNP